MEERLEKALEFTNYRQTLNNQLHKIKVRAEASLLISEAGGKFTINPELMAYVDLLIRQGYEDATLLDDNKYPVHIEDTKAFLNKMLGLYHEVVNDYFQEASALKKARNVKSILGIKELE